MEKGRSFTGSATLAIYFSLKDPILAQNIYPSIHLIEREGTSLKVESKSGLCGLRCRCKMGCNCQAAAFMNVLARLSVSGPEVRQVHLTFKDPRCVKSICLTVHSIFIIPAQA